MKNLFYLFLYPITVTAFFLRMNQQDFFQFKLQYKKSYLDGQQEQKAYQNFCLTKQKIQHINSCQSSYSVSINEMADQDIASIVQNRLNLKMSNRTSFPKSALYFESHNQTLYSKDWVNEGKVRPVKDQGNCGSCWAFSTVGAIESMVDIHHGIKEPLSDQELVDCSDENFGCSGGWMHEAMYYVKEANGLYRALDYPYVQKENRECKYIAVPKIKEASRFNVVFVKEDSPSSLNHALLLNPVCIAVDANDYGFLFYKDGIYDRPLTDPTSINHAVLLTSYENQGEFWTLKNSWGTSWGKKGYMHIKKREDHGVAGMNSYCVFPKARN